MAEENEDILVDLTSKSDHGKENLRGKFARSKALKFFKSRKSQNNFSVDDGDNNGNNSRRSTRSFTDDYSVPSLVPSLEISDHSNPSVGPSDDCKSVSSRTNSPRRASKKPTKGGIEKSKSSNKPHAFEESWRNFIYEHDPLSATASAVQIAGSPTSAIASAKKKIGPMKMISTADFYTPSLDPTEQSSISGSISTKNVSILGDLDESCQSLSTDHLLTSAEFTINPSNPSMFSPLSTMTPRTKTPKSVGKDRKGRTSSLVNGDFELDLDCMESVKSSRRSSKSALQNGTKKPSVEFELCLDSDSSEQSTPKSIEIRDLYSFTKSRNQQGLSTQARSASRSRDVLDGGRSSSAVRSRENLVMVEGGRSSSAARTRESIDELNGRRRSVTSRSRGGQEDHKEKGSSVVSKSNDSQMRSGGSHSRSLKSGSGHSRSLASGSGHSRGSAHSQQYHDAYDTARERRSSTVSRSRTLHEDDDYDIPRERRSSDISRSRARQEDGFKQRVGNNRPDGRQVGYYDRPNSYRSASDPEDDLSIDRRSRDDISVDSSVSLGYHDDHRDRRASDSSSSCGKHQENRYDGRRSTDSCKSTGRTDDYYNRDASRSRTRETEYHGKYDAPVRHRDSDEDYSERRRSSQMRSRDATDECYDRRRSSVRITPEYEDTRRSSISRPRGEEDDFNRRTSSSRRRPDRYDDHDDHPRSDYRGMDPREECHRMGRGDREDYRSTARRNFEAAPPSSGNRHVGFHQRSHATGKAQDIEISPGVYRPLRGSDQTFEAVMHGEYVKCQCMVCSLSMYCIDDAEYVLCPDCVIVSSMEVACIDDQRRSGGARNWGVGLGFKSHDLQRMQDEIRFNRR